ncbi:MAG: hypothetical protein AAB683_02555 [Patescibacteria group bacterium]
MLDRTKEFNKMHDAVDRKNSEITAPMGKKDTNINTIPLKNDARDEAFIEKILEGQMSLPPGDRIS